MSHSLARLLDILGAVSCFALAIVAAIYDQAGFMISMALGMLAFGCSILVGTIRRDNIFDFGVVEDPAGFILIGRLLAAFALIAFLASCVEWVLA